MPQTSTDNISVHNNKSQVLKDDESDSEIQENASQTGSESQFKTVTPAKDWPNLKPSIKVYKMNSKPRGLSLIIDIQEFTRPDLKFREGSQIDAENLKQLFTQLDFTVTMEKNLPGAKMRKTIRRFSQQDELGDADMCIVAILSHGTEKEVFGSDGVPIPKEWIMEKFNNIECEELVDKPKFFIFQSCQGEQTDIGIERDDQGTNQAGIAAASMSSNEKPRKRPAWEDILIAHSTVPGYVSNRDQDQGSWFIQCLCDIFREQAADTDIRDMLDEVSERLTTYESEAGTVQSCTLENRHFVKKLYFNPGLYKTKKGK